MDFEHFIYKNQLLPVYCDSIGVPLLQVKNIFRRLRRQLQHENKSNEELLTYIMDHIFEFKEGIKYSLFYHNEPLIIFCHRNPQFTYDQLVGIITYGKKLEPLKSTDDILDEYFAKKNYRHFR
ncbi:MAG: hypothetical protein IKZ96_02340 [Bacilli bacterium]|nr:hypothetical protein [Bacilli bacterium]